MRRQGFKNILPGSSVEVEISLPLAKGAAKPALVSIRSQRRHTAIRKPERGASSAVVYDIHFSELG